MAAKAWESKEPKAIDEIFFSNDAVSLCLLVHRRAKTMRVIDFRAGPNPAKRMFVLKLAQREGVEKVYTLVERDEVSAWTKLGFRKEGNIPGFYKRSDAFLLGSSAHAPARSETRIAVQVPGAPMILQTEEEDDADEMDNELSPERVAAMARCEKTVVQAKKAAKDYATKALPIARVTEITNDVAAVANMRKAIDKLVKAGQATTAFEPFGRDVVRRYFHVTARGGYELFASAETQSCFGNAFLELVPATRPLPGAPQAKVDAEKFATVSSVKALCDKFLAEGVVSVFSLAPSDDVPMAGAFAFSGFRRTGLLASHMVVGSARKDAIVWSRKLADPKNE